MVAVRITRPEDIAVTPVARDITPANATGQQFGAGTLRAVADLGETFGAIGSHLMAKSQDSADKVGISTYSLEYEPAARKVIEEARSQYPDAGPEYTKRVSEGLDQVHTQTLSGLSQRGIRLSPKAVETIGIGNTERKTRFLSEAVSVAHNAQIAGLRDQQAKNFEALRGRILSGELGIDDAVGAVDKMVSDSGQLYGSAELRKQADTWKTGVVDAAIASLESSGRESEAKALRDRFYGRVASRGGSSQVSGVGAIVDRIIGVESGGNPTARAATSSASGLGQFTDGTWIATIQKHRPDLFNSMSRADLLRLKTDRALGREMTTRLTEDNIQFLGSRGFGATPGNVYLAHFLGQGGAAAVLSAAPNTPVSQLIDRQAIDANRSILEGKTAGEVVAWSTRKMGGVGAAAEMPNADKALYWENRLNVAAGRRVAQQETAQIERYERQIIDAGAMQSPLPSRSDIESDPSISEPKRNDLLRKYDAAAKDVVKLQAVLAKFNDPEGGAFNPFDPDERKAVDGLYKALGGNMNALQAVVNRTNMLPATAARDLRSSLVSGDAGMVSRGLQVTSNLMRSNPHIFAGVDGKEELEKAAIGFTHSVEAFGMSAEKAAQQYIERQTPEYKAKLQTRMKSEDIDGMIRKQAENGTLDSDLRSAFGGWFNRPDIGFNPEARASMRSDYAERVKEHYLETGDMSEAKKLAQSDVKKVWGVTRINGSATVVRFAPENSPVYAGIPDVSKRMADQAVADIKGQTGQDVDRRTLMLSIVPRGGTSQAYMAGQVPSYMLAWRDKNGAVQTSQRPWIADPARMRAALTEERERDMAAAVERNRDQMNIPIEAPARLREAEDLIDLGRERTAAGAQSIRDRRENMAF